MQISHEILYLPIFFDYINFTTSKYLLIQIRMLVLSQPLFISSSNIDYKIKKLLLGEI